MRSSSGSRVSGYLFPFFSSFFNDKTLPEMALMSLIGRQECPDGKLTRSKLRELFKSVFPEGEFIKLHRKEGIVEDDNFLNRISVKFYNNFMRNPLIHKSVSLSSHKYVCALLDLPKQSCDILVLQQNLYFARGSKKSIFTLEYNNTIMI
jgi:hypothetical protein